MRTLFFLLVSALAALAEQNSNTLAIETNNGVVQVKPPSLSVAPRDGLGEFKVVSNGIRPVRFEAVPGSSTPTMFCDEKQIIFVPGTFYWINGTIACQVKSSGSEFRVRLHLLQPDPHRVEAAVKAMEKSETNVLPIEHLNVPPENNPPVLAELMVQAAATGGPSAPVQGKPPGENQTKNELKQTKESGSPALLLSIFTLLAVLALAAGGWWFLKRPISDYLPFARSKLEKIESQGKQNFEALSSGAAIRQEEMAAKIDARISALQQMLLADIGESIGEYGNAILDSLKDLKTTVLDMKTVTDDSEAMRRKNTDQASGIAQYLDRLDKKLERIDSETQKQRSAVGQLESSLKTAMAEMRAMPVALPIDNDGRTPQNMALASAPATSGTVAASLPVSSSAAPPRNEKLELLLRSLPENYLTTNPGESAVNRLDQLIAEIFRQAAPSREGLRECNKRIHAFAMELAHLLQGIQVQELTEKLKPMLNDLRHLNVEVDDLLLASGNTMRLHFEAEFYASSANRDRLIDAIGAGLRKQIVKLENPADYFMGQFHMIAGGSIQMAADILDANVDQMRNNETVQRLFNNLLQASGIEQIAPRSGEEFQAMEHRRLQTVESADGKGRGVRVDRLIERGFRRGNEVIRKAAVIVCE